MKKIVFILVFGCSLLWSATLVVDINPTNMGFTTMSCKGTTSPYSTIQSAIDDASEGDTIEICKGTYSENLNVDKDNLIIQGVARQNIDDVVIDGGSDTAITVKSKNETLDNFKVTSSSIGIYIYDSNGGDQTLKNLIISSDGGGIYADKSGKISCDTLDINSSNGMGINISNNVEGDHTFKNITVNSSDDSIYIGRGGKSFANLKLNSTDGSGLKIYNTDANLTFSNMAIQSKKEGIYTDYHVSGTEDFQDINISSGGDGIVLYGGAKVSCSTLDVNSSSGKGIYIKGASGKHTLDNITVNSSDDSIYVRKGGKSFTNLDLKSANGVGLEVVQTDENLTFSNIAIQSKKEGFIAGYYATGAKDLQDINISSGEDGVYIRRGQKISCDTLDINSSNGRGIYIEDSSGDHTLNNITVNSSDDSIYVRKGGKSFTNLDLNSTNKSGIYLQNATADLTFSNIAVHSKTYGIHTDSSTAAKDFKDINISSGDDGIHIEKGTNVSFDTLDINSSEGKGLYVYDMTGTQQLYKNIKIVSADGSSYGAGIYIDKTSADLIFSNISIKSTKYGIYTGYNAETGIRDFKDVNISSEKNGINIKKGGKVSCDTLDINSSNGIGIELSGSVKGDHTFNNIKVNSLYHSIYIGSGGESFANLELNSTNSMGLYVAYSHTDMTFSNITVHSKDRGIYLSNDTETKDFKDINISSGGDGIYVYDGAKNSFDTVDINSSDGRGIWIYYNSLGDHTFNNIKVNSKSDSIYVDKGFSSINDANLTSSEGSGIVEAARIDTNVTNVQINSKKTGIYFDSDNKYVDILVKCSIITSSDSENGIDVKQAENLTLDSVYIKKAKKGIEVSYSVKNAIIKNSKIENTTDYAVYLGLSSSSSATINNNCFSGAKLAYASRSGYDFDGNYWDGVSDSDGDDKITHSDDPVKISNYVVDNSPKDSCNVDQQCTNTSSPPIEEEINNYKFDAWDIFRDISDKNISTKIVGQDFNLTIASLDENGSALADFNGTVCIRALDDTNSSLNSWQKIYFNDEDQKNITVNGINVARKKARIQISWKNGVDESCPLSNEDNSTLSSDNFAIRPDRFIITAQAPFYAGDDFDITFQALDGSDTNCSDYNETKGVSFLVESNIIKPGCYQGTISVNNFSFQNGKAKDINASYSNIGDINITIKEKLGSEFAIVDADDTNDNERLIEENSTKITVIPYDINITNVLYQNSTGKSWLYDANVSDMNVTIETTVKAFAKGSATSLPDFNATCYAKDVNLSFLYDANYSDNNVSLDTISLKGNLSYQDINSSSILILSSQFINGEANASYAFNVKRAYNRPLNPVKIELKDINITTTSISKNQNSALQTGNISSDQNSTFYYGRIYAQDLETTKKITSSNIFIDVYCNGCNNDINKFFQDSLNWYKNEFDTSITKKTDITILPKEGFLLSSPNKSNISISNITDANSSKISFDVTNSKDEYDTALFHLLIPRWLWYNAYKDYNASSGSNCSTHPCIGYRMLPSVNSSINSGTFKGSDIGHEQNRTIKKAGVKVYR